MDYIQNNLTKRWILQEVIKIIKNKVTLSRQGIFLAPIRM